MEFITPTPTEIAKVLKHFGFKPELKEMREDFTQWRKNVGEPTELYADVYKSGEVKLYSRFGLLNFPKGCRPGKLTERFEGKLQSDTKGKELVRLFAQVGFIKYAEFKKFNAQSA